MADLKFEITKHIGVISQNDKGWSKELNMVSWNDREPKYDLRDWSADKSKMSKGVTLTKQEALKLAELLSGIE